MTLVSGLGTTYNMPNYHGPLLLVTPQDTPFFTAIGGLSGGKRTDATEFEWQTEDLRSAGQNVALEGANAPTASGRARAAVTNVLQIHQETVGVSYTKLAAVGQFAGANINGANPVTNELDHQVMLRLAEMKRDIEFSFIQGTYQKPANNSTARQTRGILAAITTNVTANSPAAALTETMVLDLMQSIWENGGIQESETATILCNAAVKRDLTYLFVTAKNYQEGSRTVGGVRCTTIETDFGTLNIMLDRHMPTSQLAVVSLEQCAPVFLEVPGKGVFFAEELSRVGASVNYQLYGEIGLEYGNEKCHGKITGIIPGGSSVS